MGLSKVGCGCSYVQLFVVESIRITPLNRGRGMGSARWGVGVHTWGTLWLIVFVSLLSF